MATAPYVPNELLSRLVGERMYSVEFVLNDYVQLRFDGPPAGGPVILNCYVWPAVQTAAMARARPRLRGCATPFNPRDRDLD